MRKWILDTIRNIHGKVEMRTSFESARNPAELLISFFCMQNVERRPKLCALCIYLKRAVSSTESEFNAFVDYTLILAAAEAFH